MQTQILGVFENLNGEGATMNFGDTLLISVIGFGIVFVVLGFLAVFVFCMGKVFDAIGNKKVTKAVSSISPITNDEVATNEVPLPANQSIGDLTLINTTEEQAAVIMAITSAKSGIPLNRLKFNTIKCLEDNK